MDISELDSFDSTEPSQAKLIGVMFIVTALDLFLLVFSIIMVRRIYKLIQLTDKPMLFSILSITLALLFFLVWCILSIIQAILKTTTDEHILNSPNGDNILRAVDYFKVTFTFSAFVFDLYKWCLFIVASNTNHMNDRLLRQQLWLKRGLIVAQMIMFLATQVFIIGILTTEGGTEENKKWLFALRMFTVSVFSVFLFIYIAVSYILTTRLMKYFPKFYVKERVKIFTSTGVIIFSIFARIINNLILSQFQKSIDDSYDNATWLFPMVNLLSSIFASLFPLGAILISLMYAVNQKKRIVILKKQSKVKGTSELTSPDSWQSFMGHFENNSENQDDEDSLQSSFLERQPALMNDSGGNQILLSPKQRKNKKRVRNHSKRTRQTKNSIYQQRTNQGSEVSGRPTLERVKSNHISNPTTESSSSSNE